MNTAFSTRRSNQYFAALSGRGWNTEETTQLCNNRKISRQQKETIGFASPNVTDFFEPPSTIRIMPIFSLISALYISTPLLLPSPSSLSLHFHLLQVITVRIRCRNIRYSRTLRKGLKIDLNNDSVNIDLNKLLPDYLVVVVISCQFTAILHQWSSHTISDTFDDDATDDDTNVIRNHHCNG